LLLLTVPFVLRGRFRIALVPVLAVAAGRLCFGTEARDLRDTLPVAAPRALRYGLEYGVAWQTLVAAAGLLLLATVLRPARRRLSPGWIVALVPVVGLLAAPGWVVFLEYGTLPDAAQFVAVPVAITAGIPVLCLAWTVVDPRVTGAAAWWLAVAGLRLLVLTGFYADPLHEFLFVSDNRAHYVRDRITLLTVPVALLVALWCTRRAVRARARL
jgi:hypothetical protein